MEEANFILNGWSFIHKSYLEKIVQVIILQLIINKITSTILGCWHLKCSKYH